MMKRTAILSLAVFAFAACSGGGSTGGATGASGTATTAAGGTGGSSSSGGSSTTSAAGCGPAASAGNFNVLLTSVGVHPAAAAALTALGLTPPALAGTYSVILQGVTLSAGAPKTTTLGEVVLTDAMVAGTTPVEFDNVSFAGGVASLGIISAVVPTNTDGGVTAPPAPTCAQLESTPVGTFTDFYVPAGGQVHFGTPTADVCNGVAFALPASYISLLDCAQNLVPGGATDLLSVGFSLMYASADAAALGAPLSGVTYSNAAGTIFYYPAGYAANSATQTGPTTSTGVGTITGISGLGTVKATDAAMDSFSQKDLATPAGDAYMVFFAPGN